MSLRLRYRSGMRSDATFSPAGAVIVKTVGDELVLLDYAREVYYGLDPIGARVWQLLTEGSTCAAVVDALLGEHDVTREQVSGDVDRLIGELLSAGLLTEKT
jgi:hypothetical protein